VSSVNISTDYRELAKSEIASVAEQCAQAWQDPAIPRRQYELAAKPELDKFRMGEPAAPFYALLKCLEYAELSLKPSLLDVGASGGYYKEVFEIDDFSVDYRGCDFSPAFKSLAEDLYPGIAFDVADARALPYADESFDVVLHGALLMHCREYREAIREAARVAKRYVIFHRTPVLLYGETKYWLKRAYDVPCLEIHFNEQELLGLFAANNLTLIHTEDVFFDTARGFGHRSYLLAKS
jgi:hypothetical protein